MTPTTILAISIAVLIAAVIFTLRRVTRYSHAGRAVDLGVVSTRWLSELRRDEPWSRS